MGIFSKILKNTVKTAGNLLKGTVDTVGELGKTVVETGGKLIKGDFEGAGRKLLTGTGETIKKAGKTVWKTGEDIVDTVVDVGKEVGESIVETVDHTGRAIKKYSEGDILGGIGEQLQPLVKPVIRSIDDYTGAAQNVKSSWEDSIDTLTDYTVPNKEKLKVEEKKLHNTIMEYNDVLKQVQIKSVELHEIKNSLGRKVIDKAIEYIDNISSTPKYFNTAIIKIEKSYNNFDNEKRIIQKKINSAKESLSNDAAKKGVISAASAALAPQVAISIATTFGTASTGVAISSLSGVAASNAALAWLGGGAVAAGGGGMAVGSALLAALGPISLAIGAGAIIFSGAKMNKQCAEIIDDIHKKRKEILNAKASLDLSLPKIEEFYRLIKDHIKGIDKLLEYFKNKNLSSYNSFKGEDKTNLIALINNILSYEKLINTKID